MAFHLVLFLIRAIIRVVVLVFCSNVPAIGLARLVVVHRLKTCLPVSAFSASLILRRVVILATVGRESVVFRLMPSSGRVGPVFRNRSQHRRDVISLTLPFALRIPWKGPLELCLGFLLPFPLHYVE